MASIDRDLSTNGSGASRSGDPVTDIFSDLEALRLSVEDANRLGSEEILAHVSIRRPTNAEFVRVHPDPTMSIATSVFVDPERDTYLVLPAVRSILVAGVKAVLLTTAVNQRGVVFLWPLALGDGTGRQNVWHETGRQAAEMAKHEWIKLVADMQAGHYRIFKAQGALPDPVFPAKTLDELLRIAFRNRIVEGADHPVVKQSLGLIP
jgi:hypothetical protein